MGSHNDCADWDYETHPDQKGLVRRCAFVGRKLSVNPRRFDRYGVDTKVAHKFIFRKMAPPACRCLAGNFRGSSLCSHLANYPIYVGDPLVGSGAQASPAWVTLLMSQFEARCTEIMSEYQTWISGNGAGESREKKLLRFVKFLAEILERFLTIHPFANGNGHTGRLLVAVLLTRNGYPIGTWPVEASPDYYEALSKHRRGEPKPLMKFLLGAIQGKPIQYPKSTQP